MPERNEENYDVRLPAEIMVWMVLSRHGTN